jgi:hypothetical protein
MNDVLYEKVRFMHSSFFSVTQADSLSRYILTGAKGKGKISESFCVASCIVSLTADVGSHPQ